MKYIYIILFLFIPASKLFAQTDTSAYYLNVEGQITTKDSADFVRFVYPPDVNTDKDLYIVKDYYLNGRLKFIGKSFSNGPTLSLQGMTIEFFDTGRRKSFKSFERGRPSGEITSYFPNGRLHFIKKYNQYNRLLLLECRDSVGTVLTEKGNGHWVEYDTKFVLKVADGSVKKNLEDGEWICLVKDSLKCKYYFTGGELIHGISYEADGKEHQFRFQIIEPVFSGNNNSYLNTYIFKNIKLLDELRLKKINGTAYVNFIVHKDGSMSDLTVDSNVGQVYDEAIYNTVKKMSLWTPGIYCGVTWDMKCQLTIGVPNGGAFLLADPL